MKTIEYEPLAGSHIDYAIQHAVGFAKHHHARVRMRFNDVTLVATPKTSRDSLRWTFDKTQGESAQHWRTTPRGLASARRRKRELAANQRIVDDLIGELPASLASGLDDTVAWLSRFARVADDCGLRYSKPEIAQALRAAGYTNNQHVGRPQEDFDSSLVTGQWIVGQAINCLEHGMPPHPITRKFAAKYQERKRLESKQ
jgi:hypothetical protein